MASCYALRMAETSDLVPELLLAIRDEMRGMRAEQHSTNERLDKLDRSTNERFDRVERRQTETDLHLGTAIAELQRATEQNTAAIRTLAVETHALHDRIDHVLIGPVGAKIRELDERVTALEGRKAG